MFRSSVRLRIAKISVLLPTNLLSGTLLRQSLFESALSARFQVVGVTPHFLDDVFRLPPPDQSRPHASQNSPESRALRWRGHAQIQQYALGALV